MNSNHFILPKKIINFLSFILPFTFFTQNTHIQYIQLINLNDFIIKKLDFFLETHTEIPSIRNIYET